jgi:pimeloyl-ACP methyl ester carboxylesterase
MNWFDRWVAGGHSWGAVLALLYALRFPERTLGVLYVAGNGLEWPQWKSQHQAEFERRLTSPRTLWHNPMERKASLFGHSHDARTRGYGCHGRFLLGLVAPSLSMFVRRYDVPLACCTEVGGAGN